MRSPASIAGHPIHPMLVPIAIGGYVISFVADLIGLCGGDPAVWNLVAYYTMLIGIFGALVAAVPGFVDFLSLPQGPIKNTAVMHMGLNLTVVALFICNAWLRHANTQSLTVPMVLSAIAILMLLVSGWLGGKLVFEAGVGVNIDAPR